MQTEEDPANIEQNAIISVWDEMGRPLPKKLFQKVWRCSRDTGELSGYYGEHFKEAGVLEDAADAMRKLVEIAQLGADGLSGENGTNGESSNRLQEARRTRLKDEEEGGGGLEPSTSTALRTEAMALLIAELVGGREDVQGYRETLPGGLLDMDQIDDFLGGQDEEKAGETLDIALDVCGAYGLKLSQSLDLVLTGRPPRLKPIHVGPPPVGSTVCQTHISFAPWASPDDASAALRKAQLRRTALQEHKARAEKDKRAALARVEAGGSPGARGLRPWTNDPDYTPPPRRPRLNTAGRKLGGPKERSLRVFISVSRQWWETDEKLTWETLMENFNSEHENDKYTQVRSFTKTYKDARAALPAWLPIPA